MNDLLGGLGYFFLRVFFWALFVDVVRCSGLDLHVPMVVISRFQTVVALGGLFSKVVWT